MLIHRGDAARLFSCTLTITCSAKNDLKVETDPFRKAVLDGRQLALKVWSIGQARCAVHMPGARIMHPLTWECMWDFGSHAGSLSTLLACNTHP